MPICPRLWIVQEPHWTLFKAKANDWGKTLSDFARLKEKLENSPDWQVIFIGIGTTSPRIITLAHTYRTRFALMYIPDAPPRDGPLSWQAFIPTPDDRYATQHGLGLLAVSDTSTDAPRAFIISAPRC